jgi:hypothetical protein
VSAICPFLARLGLDALGFSLRGRLHIGEICQILWRSRRRMVRQAFGILLQATGFEIELAVAL